ncbi:MAG TPA: glucoamylase family protein, partial [Bacillales bacterium]|nr:glucoamylase family protein [Bacillales bacterium]
MRNLSILALTVLFMFSISLSSVMAYSNDPGPEKLNNGFHHELKAVAKNTWRFFKDNTDPVTHLPLDEIRLGPDKSRAERTSPTNIAMYLMSVVSAEELGFIDHEQAVNRVRDTLNTIEDMKKWHGFLYNWYNTEDASLKKDWGQFISTVDNGWYASGLIVVRQAYPEIEKSASRLLESMDFSLLYNAKVGQMFGGYDVAKGQDSGYTFGMFNTEPRVASYIAIGKGDVPPEHWWKMFRTFPPEWAQQQRPEGITRTYHGVEVYEGHYTYKGIKYVPSWGGSMFETLMPTLVLKEQKLAKNGLGLNDARQVKVQMAYAKEKGYAAWGISPAATPTGYAAFGVPMAGTFKQGYKENGTIAPYASLLALEFARRDVRDNLKELKSLGAYGKYGF